MIQSVEINNYQSHKKTLLELHQGVNVIIGTSDSGKSAIKRSIEFVIKNRPSGDSMRSWWGGKTSVELVLDNGRVERSKDKIEEYVVNEETKLHAFGLTVPDEVTKVINITEVNIQSQMDAPFLLSETSGAVASHFNRVAGLDKIDASQSWVDSRIREINSSIKTTNQDIEKHTLNLEKYSGLKKIEIELEVLEEFSTQYQIKITKQSKLNSLLIQIAAAEKEIEESAGILVFEKEVDSILVQMTEARDQKKEIVLLTGSLDEITEINTSTEEAQYKTTLETEVLDLLKLQETYKVQNTAIYGLNKALKDIKGISISLEADNRNLELQMTKFKKEMGDVCVLCGSVIKK